MFSEDLPSSPLILVPLGSQFPSVPSSLPPALVPVSPPVGPVFQDAVGPIGNDLESAGSPGCLRRDGSAHSGDVRVFTVFGIPAPPQRVDAVKHTQADKHLLSNLGL